MLMTEERIIEIFKEHDAFWTYTGGPHAELTSGLCSNAYFNLSKVLCKPILVEALARALCQKLNQAGTEENPPDWVVGSAYAAITFSYEVAKQLGADHAFAEKTPVSHKMSFKRVEIPKDALVLQVEELITTMDTANAVRNAIVCDNPHPVNFFPFVGTIVYRPSKLDKNSCRIVALTKRLVWSVPPNECPLCRAGSPRFRPKEYWNKLTQR